MTGLLLDDRIRLGMLLVQWMTEFEGVDPALLTSLFGIVVRGLRKLEDGEECKCKVEGFRNVAPSRKLGGHTQGSEA